LNGQLIRAFTLRRPTPRRANTIRQSAGLALQLTFMNKLLIGAADKTDLLLQILQNETAVTVIDPRGLLARAAADQLPARLTQRALYFDPTDMAHPVGLNVLEKVPPDDRQRLTEQLCSYFEAMWPNGWGAQSNYLLANCLRLLLDNRETLLGILKLLTEPSFAEKCLLRCKDPVVLKNWQVINSWDKKQRAAALAPLQNKIGTLLLSPIIRNIIGQPHTTFGNASIIIADLDRAKLGDLTARLLGGLLIARSQGHVVINDYGFFAMPLPLPQERFTLTLNFLDELPLNLKQEMLGIEDKTVFKTNKRDAEELAFYVGALNPRKLTELDYYQAVNTFDGDIEPVRPPSLKRLKPLKSKTRACHTAPRLKVERDINGYLAEAY
jgi:hypothetical protein